MTVSIRAPVKGATAFLRVQHSKDICFNPRTREGCDGMIGAVPVFDNKVSIRAPVKGATT